MICRQHGKSHATFICHHLVHGSGVGFYYGNENDIRPDAWCYDCDQRLMQNNGEWNDEIESLAKITVICANCYDDVRLRNEIPHKRIPPQKRPTIEEDKWELASATRMNQLHPETFKIPLATEISKLEINGSVKLLFAFSDGDKISLERMWVKITKIEVGEFTGILETKPMNIKSLKLKTKIKFTSDYVASILVPHSLKETIGLIASSPKFKMSSPNENEAYY